MFDILKNFLKENLKPAYIFDRKNGTVTLWANKKELFIQLDEYYKTTQSSSCVQEGYSILCNNSNYGKLFLEYMSVQPQCDWQSLPHGNFKDLIKKQLKLKEMKTLQELDLKNFEVCSFKADDKYKLFTIIITDGKRYTFILDYEGKLSKDIVSMFDKDIDTLGELEILSLNYEGSLAKINLTENYIR